MFANDPKQETSPWKRQETSLSCRSTSATAFQRRVWETLLKIPAAPP
jgi:O6-methylguanine-DNA--protein-cysteine methyltransferase